MIAPEAGLSVSRQCTLLAVARSSWAALGLESRSASTKIPKYQYVEV